MNGRFLPFQGWRLVMFQAVIAFTFVILIARLYQLQFVDNEEYELQAEENRLQQVPIAAPRGVIYDRNGLQLALNVPAFNVVITPALLPEDADATLAVFNQLSAMVDVPATRAAAVAAGRQQRSLDELVSEGAGIAPYRAVVVAQDIPRNVAMRILEEQLTLPGVDIQVASVREYPTGELTSHIIGYLGPIPAEEAQELIEQGYNPNFDRIGYAGVEYFLENELAGQRGSRLQEVDVAGAPLRVIQQEDPLAGRNVVLTLDTELQQAAQDALERRIAIVNSEAGRLVTQSGVVIAMNPRTGEILAMVSYPAYNNTRFARAIDGDYYLTVADDPLVPLLNRSIGSLYPPGSVWKLITAVGVLQEGVIDPDQALFDAGTLQLPNRYAPNDEAAAQTFFCWLRSGHEEVAMLRAIAQSCDVYFYQVGGGNPAVSPEVLRTGGLGIDDLYRYAIAFGIGTELGVELPGELAGRMPDRDWKRRIYGENWSTGDTYNAAFGQGYVTVTPLQLLNSTAAIVNGGTLYQPTIINRFLDAEGNVVEGFSPHVIRTIHRPAPGEEVRLLMIEDMIIQGQNSLVCRCEPDSEFYEPGSCDPENYSAMVDVGVDPLTPVEDLRPYTVSVPLNYAFNGRICDRTQFDPTYEPPFTDQENLALVREGMQQAVEVGTAIPAQRDYVLIAGKTGTAEYCDDVARPLGLCVPGNWPAHAWFTAYAPYEDPEIIIISFVYNGGEGSLVALPIVMETMDAYFQLKAGRQPALAANTTLP